MTTWTPITFNKVVNFIDGDRGSNYPKQEEFQSKGFCLFLSTRNVPDNHFDFSECQFISEDKDSTLRKGKLQKGDYVLTTRGTVGNFAHYDNRIPYGNVRINSGMVILRTKDDIVDNNFVQYLLQSPTFKAKIKGRSTGSAQPQLPIRNMESIEFLIPPKTIQVNISSVLKSYDDLIENNEKRIKILEEMAQRLYTEWFVKFKFPGHEKVKMVDSGTEYGMIPEGWKIGHLKDVVVSIKKSTYPGSRQLDRKYVPIVCIDSKELLIGRYESSEMAVSSLLLFEAGDILFGAMRPYFHKVAIAFFSGITRSTCLVLRPKNALYFSALTLFRDDTIKYATNHSKGATIPYVNWDGNLANKPCVIPPNNIVRIFEKKVAALIINANNLKQTALPLTEMRDILIPQLINGKRKLIN